MNLVYLTLVAVFLASSVSSDSFDVRNKWSCNYEILQQGCGDCWNFAATEALSDRLCASGEAKGMTMSPEVSLDCNGKNGCNGGTPSVAWNYFIANGTTTCTSHCNSGCYPYTCTGKPGLCHYEKCNSGSKWPATYYGGSFKRLKANAVSSYQQELKANGPIHMLFQVYDNFSPFFASNPNGIYTHTSGNIQGNHVVKLMGWGTSGGIDYWTLANSWGTGFAEHGYFKMQRGINLALIENQVSAGYTRSQKPALSPQEFLEDDSPEIPGGAWIEQKDIDQEVFFLVAKFAFNRIGEKEERVLKLNKIVGVETQVVAGVNYRIKAETKEGESVEVTVYRDLDWDLTLMEYQFFL